MNNSYHRLNAIWSNATLSDGIFARLSQYNMPWDNDINTMLDMDYHGNVSGNKIVSALCDTLLLSDDSDTLSDTSKNALARVIASLCVKRWTKLYATMSLTYDPISNYSMVEVMTNDTTTHQHGHTIQRTDNLTHSESATNTVERTSDATRTDNLTASHTGTDTVTPNTTETRTDDLTQTLTDTVSAFNSTGYQPDSEHTTENDGTQTTTRTGTESTQYNTTLANSGTQRNQIDSTDTTTDSAEHRDTGTQTTTNAGTDTDTRNYRLTRDGNIGVTTSQQMIESERQLWLWDFFRTVVYPDIDRVLTIPIY